MRRCWSEAVFAEWCEEKRNNYIGLSWFNNKYYVKHCYYLMQTCIVILKVLVVAASPFMRVCFAESDEGRSDLRPLTRQVKRRSFWNFAEIPLLRMPRPAVIQNVATFYKNFRGDWQTYELANLVRGHAFSLYTSRIVLRFLVALWGKDFPYKLAQVFRDKTGKKSARRSGSFGFFVIASHFSDDAIHLKREIHCLWKGEPTRAGRRQRVSAARPRTPTTSPRAILISLTQNKFNSINTLMFFWKPRIVWTTELCRVVWTRGSERPSGEKLHFLVKKHFFWKKKICQFFSIQETMPDSVKEELMAQGRQPRSTQRAPKSPGAN
jgi:hypothetical protein